MNEMREALLGELEGMLGRLKYKHEHGEITDADLDSGTRVIHRLKELL